MKEKKKAQEIMDMLSKSVSLVNTKLNSLSVINHTKVFSRLYCDGILEEYDTIHPDRPISIKFWKDVKIEISKL